MLDSASTGEVGPSSPLGTWDEVVLTGLVPIGSCKAKIRLRTKNHFGSNSTYCFELPCGLKVTVKPLTRAGMAAAQAAARRAVEASERQSRERTEAGLALEGLPDLSPEAERDGFYQARLICQLAVRHVTAWTGVELIDGPAPPTPEHVAAVMELYR